MDVREYVVILKNAFTYIRSVDGFLIKIGSIVYELENQCRNGSCDPMEVFKRIIFDRELEENLSRFACYKEEIYNAIMGDPRHKILRRYITVLMERLNSLKCVEEKPIETLTPPSTWFKESHEPILIPRKERGRISNIGFMWKIEKMDLEYLIKILLIASIILFIISLILMLTR